MIPASLLSTSLDNKSDLCTHVYIFIELSNCPISPKKGKVIVF